MRCDVVNEIKVARTQGRYRLYCFKSVGPLAPDLVYVYVCVCVEGGRGGGAFVSTRSARELSHTGRGSRRKKQREEGTHVKDGVDIVVTVVVLKV